jgi:hypothetical protein
MKVKATLKQNELNVSVSTVSKALVLKLVIKQKLKLKNMQSLKL